jgi:hypothetical protein
MNVLVRQCIPNYRDFVSVTEHELLQIKNKLNYVIQPAGTNIYFGRKRKLRIPYSIYSNLLNIINLIYFIWIQDTNERSNSSDK